MPSDAVAASRVAIQVEGVRKGESDQVADGLTKCRTAFPVDDPGDLLAGHKNVAEPEVAMDRGAGRGSRAKAAVDVAEPGQPLIQERVAREALAQELCCVTVHVERTARPGAGALKPREPRLHRSEVRIDSRGVGYVPPRVVASRHGNARQCGRHQPGTALSFAYVFERGHRGQDIAWQAAL